MQLRYIKAEEWSLRYSGQANFSRCIDKNTYNDISKINTASALEIIKLCDPDKTKVE